jgi:hypothetical protein
MRFENGHADARRAMTESASTWNGSECSGTGAQERYPACPSRLAGHCTARESGAGRCTA